MALLALAPYAVGFAPLALVIFFLGRYILDPNGLRGFKSPSLAGYSSLWRIYHNVLHWGHYLAIDKAHRDLGTHVRIAPAHISILDPGAPYEIYGHGANMMKAGWYDGGAGAHRNMADTRDKAEHQAKRKMLAHAFSAKTVAELEPVLQDTILALRAQLDYHAAAGSQANLRLFLNYFTIDLFGRLLFGHRLGCLDRGDDLLDAEDREGHIYKVPFIQSLLDTTVVNTALGMMPDVLHITKPLFASHPMKRRGTDWENITYHHIRMRLEEEQELNEKGGERDPDLFMKLLRDNKGADLGLSLGEIIAESSTMMNAGTETTTASMTSTTFLLYTHPKVITKLRKELDAAFPGNTAPNFETASKLPYLRACIEESMRVRPASSFGLPRIVPEGGRVIAGRFVPGGVTVSVPTYSLLRDKSVFGEDAAVYDPDRWMTDDKEKKDAMTKAHLPFSTGPRACIGRNISYFEQIVVIASIVKFYDCKVEDGFSLETQERFNSNPGPLPMSIRKRVLCV